MSAYSYSTCCSVAPIRLGTRHSFLLLPALNTTETDSTHHTPRLILSVNAHTWSNAANTRREEERETHRQTDQSSSLSRSIQFITSAAQLIKNEREQGGDVQSNTPFDISSVVESSSRQPTLAIFIRLDRQLNHSTLIDSFVRVIDLHV